MKNENDLPELSPKEKLKLENELLRSKLTAEFGMQKMESSLLDEEENQWLNYMYEFEKSFAQNKRVQIYDFIGKPEFKKIEQLGKDEVSTELERIMDIMLENNIVLDLICDYDDEVIYKFITEELFQEETDDMRIEGMKHCFFYEEFHPNHEYDIKKSIEDLFDFFLQEKFDEEYYKFVFLDDNIQYEGTKYSKDKFLKKLIEFREFARPSGIELLEFYKTEFDLENYCGSAEGELTYSVADNEGYPSHVSCEFKIKLKMNEYGFWEITKVEF